MHPSLSHGGLTPDQTRAVAEAVHAKYRAAYNNEIQGCCLLIADEVLQAVGGSIVAGYLTWYGGSCERSHWWVERAVGGEVLTLDPMGDDFLQHEVAPGRRVVHRDLHAFQGILPEYEHWRVA